MSENIRLDSVQQQPSLHRLILQSSVDDLLKLQTSTSPKQQDVGSDGPGGAAVYDSPEGGVVANLRLKFDSNIEMASFLKSHPRIRFLDLCFCDPLGQWHHCTFAAEMIDAKNIAAGFGFDASSIPMFQTIDNSDFIMVPAPATCFLDPFAAYPTLQCIADIVSPSGGDYDRCPRRTLRRAVAYLNETGIAQDAFFGPEAEFFVFNQAEYFCDDHCAGYTIDGEEAYWNTKAGGAGGGEPTNHTHNLAHRACRKQGYMTSRPMDRLSNLRSEMLLTLGQLGVAPEKHHHEVATCQMELNIQSAPALEAADNVMMLKYVVRNVANRRGKSATFMPKPIAGDNGSGMHCNQSLWTDQHNLFYDEKNEKMQLSETALYYAAGVLAHCKSILAFACPTTNSYKRLVPDFEAPVHITYSEGNRSTAIRVPSFTSEKSKRLEFRMPDGSCCPYLAFAAQVMAGVDGIKRKLALPPQGVGNLFAEGVAAALNIDRAPTSLDGALDALEKDHAYLLEGGAFTEALITTFIKFKRLESRRMHYHPHPREFELYYGV